MHVDRRLARSYSNIIAAECTWVRAPGIAIIFYLLQEWNDELSYLAQFWSTECTLTVDEERSIQSSEFDYVGQNMADTASYSVNYTILMQNKWFTQGKGYDFYTGYCTDEDGNQDEDGIGCEYYRQVSHGAVIHVLSVIMPAFH